MTDIPESTKPSAPQKNALFNLAGFAWPVALMLFSTRYLVHTLGEDRYGTWLVANAFLSLAAFTQFGLNDATTFFVAKHEGQKEHRAAARSAATTVLIYGLVGSVAAISLALFAPQIVRVFMGKDLSPESRSEAVLLVRIVVWAFPLALMLGGLKAAAAGLQQYKISMFGELTRATIWSGVAVGFVWAGWGMVPLAAASLLAFSVATVLVAVLLRRAGLKISFSPGSDRSPSTETAKEMLRYGTWTWLTSIAALSFGVLDRLLVGSLLGTRAVTLYGVPQSLALRIHQVAQTVTQVIFPLIGSKQDDAKALANIYAKGHTVVMLIAGTLISGGFVAANAVLRLWMGADFAARASGAVEMLLITVGLTASVAVPYYTLLGTGRPRVVAATAFGSGIAFLGVAYLFIGPGMHVSTFAALTIVYGGAMNLLHFFAVPTREAAKGVLLATFGALLSMAIAVAAGLWLRGELGELIGHTLASFAGGGVASAIYATTIFITLRKNRKIWPAALDLRRRN